MILKTPLIALILLIFSSLLGATANALIQLGRTQARAACGRSSNLFFFQHLLKKLFNEKAWEGLFFCFTVTKHLFQLLYATFAFIFLLYTPPIQEALVSQSAVEGIWILLSVIIIILISVIADFIAQLLSSLAPTVFFKVFSPISSLALLICIPLTWPLFKILKLFLPTSFHGKDFSATSKMKEKLLELLNEPDLSNYFDTHNKKQLLSVASFKDRIAREVMVPRIDVSSLSVETPICEAAKLLVEEGYSRIPLFEESVDHVIGVLLYKDILSAYINGCDLNQPIKTLLKPVLYTPETKKLSQLLQEFRSKQSHLAIVVDEYGGTEGIVTIEDILEELVGEIADEYDYDEESPYSILPCGDIIIDAKMSIIDIEEDIGIKIPQSGEYDTLGGYIFHRAGAIPTAGWRLHHDDFDLEVLSSTERSIEKARITPHK